MSFPSDLLICDPHFHVWDNSVTKNKNLGGIADGPLCTYLSRHYCSSGASLPLSSAVHVETVVGQDGSFPIDTVAETRFVLADTAAPGSAWGAKPVGICAFVHLGRPDAAAVIGAHFEAAGPRFVGVRMIMNYSATDASLTWPQVDSDAYVGFPPGSPSANPHLPGNLALLARLGLAFDMHANWFQLAGAAATLAALGDGMPLTVLDHLGCPKLGTGDAAEDAARVGAWKAGMRALAALPRAHVKISGLEYIRKGWMAEGSEARAQVAELVLWVVATFGAERCMVASNFPVDLHMGGEVRCQLCFFAAWPPFPQPRAAFTTHARPRTPMRRSCPRCTRAFTPCWRRCAPRQRATASTQCGCFSTTWRSACTACGACRR